MAGEGDFILNVEPHVGEGNLAESISTAESLIERLRAGQAEVNAAGGRFDGAAGFTALRSMLENIIRQAESVGSDIDTAGITSRIHNALTQVTRAVEESLTTGFAEMAEELRVAGRIAGGRGGVVGGGGGRGEEGKGGSRIDVVGGLRRENERHERQRQTEVVNQRGRDRGRDDRESGSPVRVTPRLGGGSTYVYKDPQTGISRRVSAAEGVQYQQEYGQSLVAPPSIGRVVPAPAASTRDVAAVVEKIRQQPRQEDTHRTASHFQPTYTDIPSPAARVNAAAEARGLADEAVRRQAGLTAAGPSLFRRVFRPRDERGSLQLFGGGDAGRRDPGSPGLVPGQFSLDRRRGGQDRRVDDSAAFLRRVTGDDRRGQGPPEEQVAEKVARVFQAFKPLSRTLNPDQLAIPGLESLSHPFAVPLSQGLVLRHGNTYGEHHLGAYDPNRLAEIADEREEENRRRADPIYAELGLPRPLAGPYDTGERGRIEWQDRASSELSGHYPGYVNWAGNSGGQPNYLGQYSAGTTRYPGLAGHIFESAHAFDFGQDTVPIHSTDRTPYGDAFAQRTHPELAPPNERPSSDYYSPNYGDWEPPLGIQPFERAQRTIEANQTAFRDRRGRNSGENYIGTPLRVEAQRLFEGRGVAPTPVTPRPARQTAADRRAQREAAERAVQEDADSSDWLSDTRSRAHEIPAMGLLARIRERGGSHGDETGSLNLGAIGGSAGRSGSFQRWARGRFWPSQAARDQEAQEFHRRQAARSGPNSDEWNTRERLAAQGQRASAPDFVRNGFPRDGDSRSWRPAGWQEPLFDPERFAEYPVGEAERWARIGQAEPPQRGYASQQSNSDPFGWRPLAQQDLFDAHAFRPSQISFAEHNRSAQEREDKAGEAKQKKLQEILGRTPEQQRVINANEQISHLRLQQSIASGVADSEYLGQGASGDTRKVTFNDGRVAAVKAQDTMDMIHKEYLSSLIAHAIDPGTAPAYVSASGIERAAGFDDSFGYQPAGYVASAFVSGIEPNDFAAMNQAHLRQDDLYGTQSGRNLGLLDSLIGNTDRHEGNWYARPDSTVTGIDHGYASFQYAAGSPFAKANSGLEGFAQFKENKYNYQDLVDLAPRLAALRPQFEEAGHPEWHDHAEDVLKRLTAQSVGAPEYPWGRERRFNVDSMAALNAAAGVGRGGPPIADRRQGPDQDTFDYSWMDNPERGAINLGALFGRRSDEQKAADLADFARRGAADRARGGGNAIAQPLFGLDPAGAAPGLFSRLRDRFRGGDERGSVGGGGGEWEATQAGVPVRRRRPYLDPATEAAYQRQLTTPPDPAHYSLDAQTGTVQYRSGPYADETREPTIQELKGKGFSRADWTHNVETVAPALRRGLGAGLGDFLAGIDQIQEKLDGANGGPRTRSAAADAVYAQQAERDKESDRLGVLRETAQAHATQLREAAGGSSPPVPPRIVPPVPPEHVFSTELALRPQDRGPDGLFAKVNSPEALFGLARTLAGGSAGGGGGNGKLPPASPAPDSGDRGDKGADPDSQLGGIVTALRNATSLLREMAASATYLTEKVANLVAASDLATKTFEKLSAAENGFAAKADARAGLAREGYRGDVRTERANQLLGPNGQPLITRIAAGQDADARAADRIADARDAGQAAEVGANRRNRAAATAAGIAGDPNLDIDALATQKRAEHTVSLLQQAGKIGLTTGLQSPSHYLNDIPEYQKLASGVTAGQKLFNRDQDLSGVHVNDAAAQLKATLAANRGGGSGERAGFWGGGGGILSQIAHTILSGGQAGVGGFRSNSRVPQDVKGAGALKSLGLGFAGGAGYNALFALQSGVFSAVGAAVQLDKQFQLLKTDVTAIGGTGNQFGSMKENILNIADATGVAGTDIATLAAGFLGLYGNVNQANAALTAGAQILAVTGESAAQALPDIKAVIANTGLTTAQVGNAAVTVSQKTGTSSGDALSGLAAFAPTAKEFGLTPNQGFGVVAAALRGSPLSAADTGAQLSHIVETLPGQLTKLSEDGIKFKDPSNKLQDLKDVVAQTPHLSGFYQQDVIASLGGPHNTQSLSALFNNPNAAAALNGNYTDNNALSSQNALYQQSLGAAFERLKQAADKLGVALTEGAVGQSLAEIAKAGAKVVEVFADLLKGLSVANRALGGFPAELAAVALGLGLLRRVGAGVVFAAPALKDAGIKVFGTAEERSALKVRQAALKDPVQAANTDATVLLTDAVVANTEAVIASTTKGVVAEGGGLLGPNGSPLTSGGAGAAERDAAAATEKAAAVKTAESTGEKLLVGGAETGAGFLGLRALATRARGTAGAVKSAVFGGEASTAEAVAAGGIATSGVGSTAIGAAGVVGGYKLSSIGRKGGYGIGDSLAIVGGDALIGAGVGYKLGAATGVPGAAEFGGVVGTGAGVLAGIGEDAYHFANRPAQTVEAGESTKQKTADLKFNQNIVNTRGNINNELLSIADPKDAKKFQKDVATITNATGSQDVSVAKNDYLRLIGKIGTQAGVPGQSISGKSAIYQAGLQTASDNALQNAAQQAGSNVPFTSIGDVTAAFQAGQLTYAQEQTANAAVLQNLKVGAINPEGVAAYRTAQAQNTQEVSTEAVNYIAGQQANLANTQGADPTELFNQLQIEVAANSGKPAVPLTAAQQAAAALAGQETPTGIAKAAVPSKLTGAALAAQGQQIATAAQAAVQYQIANNYNGVGGPAALSKLLESGSTKISAAQATAINKGDDAANQPRQFADVNNAQVKFTPAEIQSGAQQTVASAQALTANKVAVQQAAGDSANDLAQTQYDGDNAVLKLLQKQQDALPKNKQGLLAESILTAGTAVANDSVGIQQAKLATIQSLGQIQKTLAQNNPGLQAQIDANTANEEAGALPTVNGQKQTVASIQATQAAGGQLSTGQIQVLQDNATAAEEKYQAWATDQNASLAILQAGDQFNPEASAAAQTSTTNSEIQHYFKNVAGAQAAADDPNNKNREFAKQLLAQNAANPDDQIQAYQTTVQAQQGLAQASEAFNPVASADTGLKYGLEAIVGSYGSLAGAMAAAATGNTNAIGLLTTYQNDKNSKITAIQSDAAAQIGLTQSTELFNPGKSAKTAVSGQLEAINKAYGSLAAAKAAAATGNDNAAGAVAAYNTAVYNAFQTALADKLGPLQVLAATQSAKGNVVGAAKTALTEAEAAVNAFKAASPQDAVLSNKTYAELVAAVATAKGNVLTTTVSFAETQIQELIDTNELSIGQGIQRLQALYTQAIKAGDTSEALSIKDQIQQYINQGNQNAQFDLPSNINLPTLYEARRSQGAQGGTNYYGNTGQVNVNININGNSDVTAAVNQIARAVGGSPTTGNNLPPY